MIEMGESTSGKDRAKPVNIERVNWDSTITPIVPQPPARQSLCSLVEGGGVN